MLVYWSDDERTIASIYIGNINTNKYNSIVNLKRALLFHPHVAILSTNSGRNGNDRLTIYFLSLVGFNRFILRHIRQTLTKCVRNSHLRQLWIGTDRTARGCSVIATNAGAKRRTQVSQIAPVTIHPSIAVNKLPRYASTELSGALTEIDWIIFELIPCTRTMYHPHNGECWNNILAWKLLTYILYRYTSIPKWLFLAFWVASSP